MRLNAIDEPLGALRASLKLLNRISPGSITPPTGRDFIISLCVAPRYACRPVSSINVLLNTLLKLMEAYNYPLISSVFT